MNFSKVLFVVVVAALLLIGQADAGFLKKLGKKIEGAGKRVFNAAEKALPVAVSVKALGK
ncbi:cecropin-C type 1-like [Anopheles aquasalis]|uniref:cecropin-C type 1-like n=1 Tax=Anopheles aquasalis TaxID=42839 RepID=UPI00215AF527|nr:cecropin-C type 1-like [Anopheles aquasalis]